ncbi:hypothetical protein F5B19DRAFT_489211 [Rostrohypoxylon terebratum]|nr:hypothetical protein F5B19DRAFT_489211 [Rostrohypoxylon terebratum]
MTRYNRGIAGERAAVREAQREEAKRLDEKARRIRPSLGDSKTSLITSVQKWSPDELVMNASFRVPRDRPFKERADIMPLKIDSCLDMAPIRRGSFFFMSVNCKEVDDWFEFNEGLQVATF